MNQDKLGSFLKEVSNWKWDEFVKAEKNGKFTTNESIIFALVRSCAMEKMEAIRMSLNRIDGKLKTPVKVEMPKVFYLFPNAKASEISGPKEESLAVFDKDLALEGEIIGDGTSDKPERDLPSMGLRETLSDMADYPRELPDGVIQLALATEDWIRGRGPEPKEIPMVKSVVAAHLLTMAQKRNIDALTEVFDQIDGKLTETYQVIGEDLYLTSYSEKAPEGAVLNADGILQIEASESQALWAQKLARGGKQ